MIKAWLKRIVLWLGLLLCVYALWRVRILAGDAIGRISASGWLVVGLFLVVSWQLAVLAWRQYVSAYVGLDPGWRMGTRQLGLLLVGKYLPGGIFGFLARMYDQKDAPRDRLFWAGMTEQVIGLAMSVSVGGVLYLVSIKQNLAWTCLVALLPLLAVVGIWLLHCCAIWLPWLRKHAVSARSYSWQKLLTASGMQLLQQLAWAAIVVFLVRELYGLDGYVAVGVGGAFLLAVAVGMAVIFAPGGIGVREAALVGLAAHWLGAEQAIFLTALLRMLNSLLDICAGGIAALIGEDVKATEGNEI